MPMKQLTIRGFDADLQKRLKALSRDEGISLNRAALILMRRGAGLDREGRSPKADGSWLDRYVGTMTELEERDLLKSIESCEVIDEEAWK